VREALAKRLEVLIANQAAARSISRVEREMCSGCDAHSGDFGCQQGSGERHSWRAAKRSQLAKMSGFCKSKQPLILTNSLGPVSA
jgi:hypothetical protein